MQYCATVRIHELDRFFSYKRSLTAIVNFKQRAKAGLCGYAYAQKTFWKFTQTTVNNAYL